MNRNHPYPEHAEQLIKTYVPEAAELALKYSFGDLYNLAVERDEEAAVQLEMDCEDTVKDTVNVVWQTVHV